VNSGHTLFFRASTSCSKLLKDKKYFNTVKSFRATLFFRASKLFKNLHDKKSVTDRQAWKEMNSSPTKSWNVQNKLGIQNNKLNKHLSIHVEKVKILYDSNHFRSQYIWICVFLLQVRGRSRREAATACASSHRVAFALSSLSQTVVVSACGAITFMSAL